MKKEMLTRILMTTIGVTFCAFSVALLKQASFGVDPFQCLCSGLANVVPITFGTLYVIINGAFLLFMLVFARKFIGITTFINMFLLGYVVDFSYSLLLNTLGAPSTMVGRIIYLALGLTVLCFNSALIFTANLGVSTYDWIALLLGEKSKKIPFKFWRVITDFICVGVGFFLGNNPGAGTIATAFWMGPFIAYFRRTVSEPILAWAKALDKDGENA